MLNLIIILEKHIGRGYDSVQKCNNFSIKFDVLDDGQIGWNMLCNSRAK
jgi:hypothetical protein